MYLRLLGLFIFCAACSQSTPNNSVHSDSVAIQSASLSDSVLLDSSSVLPISNSLSVDRDLGDDMMQDYFIVVADTSRNYYYLRNTMYDVSKKSGLIFDSLGRIFDPKRGIIVPYDSDDEMYAGEYFPRRFEGSELSIEYYNSYVQQSHKSNMVLVAGQYTEEYAAQKQLRKIKQFCPNAYIIPAKLYNGCMH